MRVSAAAGDYGIARCSQRYLLSRLDSRLVLLAVDAFAFEHAKETLSRRVVPATAHGTHAAGEVVRLQEPSGQLKGIENNPC